MFGYVTPLTEELKVKEHIFYKSVYCGLCKCMGKRVCSESRMTLSYDAVFLALVRFALEAPTLEFKTERCLASPFKKKVCLKNNEVLEYCSAAGALLAYYNIEDNVKDAKGLKKVVSGLMLFFSKRMRRKAGISELEGIISAKLEELSLVEIDSENATPDSAAEIFGQLLSYVFEYGLSGSNQRIASSIGFHAGKWIYLADAVDDYKKDKKRGNFNPFKQIDAEAIICAMNLELDEIAHAMALIEYHDDGIKNILENILYLGMPAKIKKILSKS